MHSMHTIPKMSPASPNSHEPLSALSLFGPSIAAFKRNFITFVVVGSLPFLLIATSIVFQIVTAPGNSLIRAAGAIITTVLLISGIVLSFLSAPTLAMTQLQSAREKTISPREAYRLAAPFFWRWFGLVILLAMIYIVAIACFIIPFFFMLRRYVLAPFYLLGQDVSISEAMRQSASDSRYYSKAVWGLVITQALLGIICAIPFFGWIAGWIPGVLYACAPAILYLRIQQAITEQQAALTKG